MKQLVLKYPKISNIIFASALGLVLSGGLAAGTVSAQLDNTVFTGDLDKTRKAAGFKDAAAGSLENTLGRYIKTFLGILGIVALVLVIYAGFTWMMAQGDEKKVESAKNILKNAVIGLIIISTSYAITNFIFEKLQQQ